jgi:uncharacterized membrane protein
MPGCRAWMLKMTKKMIENIQENVFTCLSSTSRDICVVLAKSIAELWFSAKLRTTIYFYSSMYETKRFWKIDHLWWRQHHEWSHFSILKGNSAIVIVLTYADPTDTD